MKIRNIILLLLIANFAWGQKDNNDPYIGIEIPQKWSREDFVKNEVNTISAYWYYFDTKGNIKKDSLLIYKKQFDIHENKMFGEEFGWDFETYYNAMGQITKNRIIPNIKIKSKDTILYVDIDYEYDSLNREIKTMTNKTIHRYCAGRNDEITLYSQFIDNKSIINEYVYNSNNQRIEWYQTVDSIKETEHLRANKKQKVICYHCKPRYLFAKCEYDSLSNLTEFCYLTKDSLIDYKRTCFYDDQNRVIKQIDSSWSTTTVTYEYNDTGKIVTKNTPSFNSSHTTTSYYNNDDKIVRSCYSDIDSKECIDYFYENDKLAKEIKKYNSRYYLEYTEITTYLYNTNGLLTEKRTVKDDKTIKLTRYYYE